MQIGACALFLVGAVGLLDESSRLANPQPNLSYERVSLRRHRSEGASRGRDTACVRGCGRAGRGGVETSADGGTAAHSPGDGIGHEHRADAGYTGVSPEVLHAVRYSDRARAHVHAR